MFIARAVLVLLLAAKLRSGISNANEYCTEDGCPSDTELPPGDDLQLVKAGGITTSVWNLFSSLWDTINNAKDVVVRTAYKTFQGAYKKTAEFAQNVVLAIEDFAEKVREVFREEFNTYLELFWEATVGTNPESGKHFHIQFIIHSNFMCTDIALFLSP